jgi:hypothetical protein
MRVLQSDRGWENSGVGSGPVHRRPVRDLFVLSILLNDQRAQSLPRLWPKILALLAPQLGDPDIGAARPHKKSSVPAQTLFYDFRAAHQQPFPSSYFGCYISETPRLHSGASRPKEPIIPFSRASRVFDSDRTDH